MFKLFGSLVLCVSLVFSGSLNAEAQLTPGTILVVDNGDENPGTRCSSFFGLTKPLE